MATSDLVPAIHTPPAMDLPIKLGLARLAHGISPAYSDWLTHLMVSPSKQAELMASAARKGLLWQQYASNAWHGACRHCVEPTPEDKRFSPQEWDAPPFSALAQAFLLQQQWWSEATTGVRGVSEHHEDLVEFTTRQWLDMWSPSNFIATNPQVLKETLGTGGMNLASGSANWSRDALAVLGEGRPRGVEAPWTSVYKIQRLVSAPVSFLLTSGGHNVGIVNPAAGPLVHPQASYRFATHGHGAAPADPQAWQAAAPSFQGSWWPRWHQWLHSHSSGKVKGKPVPDGIEAAPGTYVHQR